ncbi:MULTISPECIES: paeninodin family lasso peptide [Cytobacillus]|uniref:Paeninodin family lasso peptide n=1 Tax=Cytobacillus stercorigallinarum TaxID=2762240 RepID=A0ABR8QU90_9BACI|nr:paeninodin family lasso peptide [Cytobacillus stercorigallinarum]MBD7939107.1 paeninodin family lasso peptide [Cytobacillus stercorigallinarum]
MTKIWQTPILQELEIKRTMGGPGLQIPDAVQPDEDETIHYS